MINPYIYHKALIIAGENMDKLLSQIGTKASCPKSTASHQDAPAPVAAPTPVNPSSLL